MNEVRHPLESSGVEASSRLGSPVELFVNGGVAHDGLNVLAGFSERNRFDEFWRIAIGTLSHPFLDPVRSRVVGGQSVLERAAELVDHAAEIPRAQLQVDGRYKQLGGSIVLQRYLMCDDLAGFRQQLHQT